MKPFHFIGLFLVWNQIQACVASCYINNYQYNYNISANQLLLHYLLQK